jgi:hypothetical integral membrane protein (TIGR02206 family)
MTKLSTVIASLPPMLAADRWDKFAPYSALHLVTVCACLALIAALVALGRACGPPRQTTLRHILGGVGLVYWLSYNVWWNRNGIDVASGLPLQICDCSGVIAPLALVTLNRSLRATLYFWTFALTTQAFIQPALQFGPATPLFWWFWAQHTIILGYAVFDLAVLGFRPDWRDCGRACVAGAAYLAVVVPLDLWLNADYGYLGALPAAQIPPFVAALGPWPGRAVIVVVLAGMAFALVELPWQMARQAARRRAAVASAFPGVNARSAEQLADCSC